MYTIGEMLEKALELPDDGIVVWKLDTKDLEYPDRLYRGNSVLALRQYLNNCPNKDVDWDHEMFLLTRVSEGKM